MPKKKKNNKDTNFKKVYEDLKRAHKDFQEAHMAIVMRLAIIAEYRDPETGAHIMRISDYGCEIARSIGMSDKEIELYRFASPLHDIGKIAIPDSILKKTGKLSEKEVKLMQKHTVVGHRMFEGSKSQILKSAADICLNHHEQWRGGGYPNGIKGEKIPLLARIVTVVDVFDALVTKRCYKEAWTFDDAAKFIKTNAGTMFDPHLVSGFVKVLPKIKQIHASNETIREFVADSGILDKLSLSDE